MNKNSNTYIVIYTVVMVVLVAVLLSVTSLSLQPLQKANELGAKQKAILEAMGATGNYDDLVEEFVVTAEGDVNEEFKQGDALKMLDKLNDAFAAGNYPVFVNKETGVVVVPMRGKGLWNDIWGYIALDTDMNTIKGIVLDHAGETPGLGAEIKEAKFEGSFVDKNIYKEGTIEFKVRKGGAVKGATNEVDAISGATKTCDGVTNMLNTCLSYYDNYFQKNAVNAQEATVTPEVEETVECAEACDSLQTVETESKTE